MATLKAGTFRVADFRKPIPEAIKLRVMIRQKCVCECTSGPRRAACGEPFEEGDRIEFNHRPALADRDYDTDAEDFIPAQHDPAYIFAEMKCHHDIHTRGTKATTRGSVIGEGARTKRLYSSYVEHKRKMDEKSGIVGSTAHIISVDDPHAVCADPNRSPSSFVRIAAASTDVSLPPHVMGALDAVSRVAEMKGEARDARDHDRPRSSWPQGRKLQGRGFQKSPKQIAREASRAGLNSHALEDQPDET